MRKLRLSWFEVVSAWSLSHSTAELRLPPPSSWCWYILWLCSFNSDSELAALKASFSYFMYRSSSQIKCAEYINILLKSMVLVSPIVDFFLLYFRIRIIFINNRTALGKYWLSIIFGHIVFDGVAAYPLAHTTPCFRGKNKPLRPVSDSETLYVLFKSSALHQFLVLLSYWHWIVLKSLFRTWKRTRLRV